MCVPMVERLDCLGTGLVLRLGKRNSERSCGFCGDTADYYVYTDGVASLYACEDDLERVVAEASSLLRVRREPAKHARLPPLDSQSHTPRSRHQALGPQRL